MKKIFGIIAILFQQFALQAQSISLSNNTNIPLYVMIIATDGTNCTDYITSYVTLNPCSSGSVSRLNMYPGGVIPVAPWIGTSPSLPGASWSYVKFETVNPNAPIPPLCTSYGGSVGSGFCINSPFTVPISFWPSCSTFSSACGLGYPINITATWIFLASGDVEVDFN